MRASTELLRAVQELRPVFYLHPDEKLRPADPHAFLHAAEVVCPGQPSFHFPADLAEGTRVSQGSIGVSKTPTLLIATTNPRCRAILVGEVTKSEPRLSWREGRAPAGTRIVEYWHFWTHSTADFLGVGDHEGDWEGGALLLEAATSKLIAVYAAQHRWGEWRCASEVEKEGERPVLYLAQGTHATYFTADRHWRWLGWDRTLRGERLDLPAIPYTAQPYADFQGRWGRSNWWSFTDGPYGPGPWKPLPPSAVREVPRVLERCRSI